MKATASTKIIRPMSDQTGQPEGMQRYFCNACMGAFTAPIEPLPQACPAGHSIADPELTAAP